MSFLLSLALPLHNDLTIHVVLEMCQKMSRCSTCSLLMAQDKDNWPPLSLKSVLGWHFVSVHGASALSLAYFRGYDTSDRVFEQGLKYFPLLYMTKKKKSFSN